MNCIKICLLAKKYELMNMDNWQPDQDEVMQLLKALASQPPYPATGDMDDDAWLNDIFEYIRTAQAILDSKEQGLNGKDEPCENREHPKRSI